MRLTMRRGTIILFGIVNGLIIFMNYRAYNLDSLRVMSSDFIQDKVDYFKNLMGRQDGDEDYISYTYKRPRTKSLNWGSIEGIHKALPAYEKMRRVLSSLHDYKTVFNHNIGYVGITREMLRFKSVPNVGDSDHLSALFVDVLQTNRSLKIGVIGGTLSQNNVCLTKSCIYIDLVAKWLTEILDTSVTVHNAAISSTSSEYFAWCLQPHLDVLNMDIIIWELATEDYVNRELYLRYGLTSAGWPQEEVTRRILDLPNKPYLMYFNFLSAENIRKRDCVNSEYFSGRHLGKHYNVTSISWCNAVCTRLWKYGFTPDDLIYTDDLLSETSHQQGALFIINYFRLILEQVTLDVMNKTKSDESYIKNLIRLHDRFVQNTYGLSLEPVANQPIKPSNFQNTSIGPLFSHIVLKDTKCWPVSKPQYVKGQALQAIQTNGWELGYSHNENWYMSTGTNQRIIFKISIAPHQDNLNATVAIALVTCNYCGQALMWLNDMFGDAKLINSNAKHHIFAVRVIFTGVPPGDYTVSLKAMEEKPFKIGAVMTSYDDKQSNETVSDETKVEFGGPRTWGKLKQLN
ncbi:uncharacterized protein [Asterias amurensis]|uniref:uncharacterized protein n=1 Tax=Asterias amurensis TaxID=7602 RepID=UPI003AB3A955